MHRGMRSLVKHDGSAELKKRWPTWIVHRANLPEGVGERFDPAREQVFYASSDHEWAVEHILAHLDLGHHEIASGRFLPEHEADADFLAAMRMDLCNADEWEDVPMDGEPTVRI